MQHEIGKKYWSKSKRRLITIIGTLSQFAVCKGTDDKVESLKYSDLTPANPTLPDMQYEQMRVETDEDR